MQAHKIKKNHTKSYEIVLKILCVSGKANKVTHFNFTEENTTILFFFYQIP